MVAGGKKLRKLTMVALTKDKFLRGTSELYTRWEKIRRDLNDLVVSAELREGVMLRLGHQLAMPYTVAPKGRIPGCETWR